jgi:hypothetical protein
LLQNKYRCTINYFSFPSQNNKKTNIENKADCFLHRSIDNYLHDIMGVSSPVRSPSARLKRIPSRFVVAASASASASVSTPSASIQVPRQLHASGGSTVSTISTTVATVRQSARSQQSASILDQIEEEVDIADELAEEGDESDEEGDDAMMFASHRIDHGDDNFDGVPDVDFNFNDAQFRYRDGSMIDGISEFHFPLHPMGWKPLQPKPHSTCPERFEDIDNPGNWNSYVFTPLYKNKGRFPAKYPKKHPRAGHVHDTAGQVNWEYLYHCLPAGATPVPGTGQVREYKGYKFDYTGKWKVS